MIVFGKENDEINKAPFLIRAIEERNNVIKFIIALSGTKETDEVADEEESEVSQLLSTCLEVYPDENNIYEIIFENYVFHITRNESYTWLDEYEISHGEYFIVFEKSRLLDYLPQIVDQNIVEAYFPNGWKHYGIYCQNHIIDVIAVEEPKIKKCRKRKDDQ